MKRMHLAIAAAAVAGMVAVPAGVALACGMGHGGNTSATRQQNQRVEELRGKLKANSAAIAASQDQAQLLELLKQRTELQDALLAELMPEPAARSGAHRH